MKNGISLTETIIVFTIITIFVYAFFNWIFNYLVALNTIKERLIALSLAQEGLELAIALRNKAYETTTLGNWLDYRNNININLNNSYCLELVTTTGEIRVTSTMDPCEVYNYNNLLFKRLISYSNDQGYVSNLSSTIVTSRVEFLNQKVELKTILVNWK